MWEKIRLREDTVVAVASLSCYRWFDEAAVLGGGGLDGVEHSWA